MIIGICNTLSLVLIIVAYIFGKIYRKRHSQECRKCYKRTNNLSKKDYCNVCSRDIKIDSITKRFSIDIYINPYLLTALYWIILSFSIALSLISMIFSIKELILYSAITFFIANIVQFYSVCKELKFKNNGNNS